MTSWFKKHFTCIRREPSSLVGGDSGPVKTENSVPNSPGETLDRTKTIIVKNDLAKANKMIKNSNEYRDYTRNCESNLIAAENFCSKLKTNNVRNNSNSVRSNGSKVAAKTKQTRIPREINNNLGLETLMRRLRACNECTSQGKICKSPMARLSLCNFFFCVTGENHKGRKMRHRKKTAIK